MSLLEDAKKIEVKPNNGLVITPDIIELAVAWAKEEKGLVSDKHYRLIH